MPGNYSHTNRSDGLTLTASVYNADHQNHINNATPAGGDDYSANVSQMQTTTDPGEVGSESLASSLAGELERIRFALKEMKGTVQWYETRDVVVVLSRDTALQSLANTVAETSIFSYSVPGGTLGTTRMLRLTMIAGYNNNSGANRNITIRLKYGATTLVTLGINGVPASASTRFFKLEALLTANNATNLQVGTLRVMVGGAGQGNIATDLTSVDPAIFENLADAPEDSTAAKTLTVTAEHSFAHAALTLAAHARHLELV